MPIFIFLLGYALYLIFSFDANAFTVEQQHDFGRSIDISTHEIIESYVCRKINCNIPFHVDEFKITGNEVAAIRISARYYF